VSAIVLLQYASVGARVATATAFFLIFSEDMNQALTRAHSPLAGLVIVAGPLFLLLPAEDFCSVIELVLILGATARGELVMSGRTESTLRTKEREPRA